jgi:Flp pilus assembly protein TadG
VSRDRRYGAHRDGTHRDRGSLTVELVVLTPVIVLFVLTALAFGRFELAREQVIGAARAGAEAASVAPSAGAAQPAAVAAAMPMVTDGAHSCTQVHVVADTENFVPGGSVRVAVSCQISFGDLLIPGVPGHAEVSAVVSAPIDPFRSIQ